MLCSLGDNTFRIDETARSLLYETHGLIEGWECRWESGGVAVKVTMRNGDFVAEEWFDLPYTKSEVRTWMLEQQDRMLQEAAACLIS